MVQLLKNTHPRPSRAPPVSMKRELLTGFMGLCAGWTGSMGLCAGLTGVMGLRAGLPQVDIPNILKQRKQLAKLVLDYDSARARWVF